VGAIRTGSNEGHVAAQHVEQLGQLVQAGLAEQPSDRGDGMIAVYAPLGVGAVVNPHRAELESLDGPPGLSDSTLAEQDGAGAGETNQKSQGGHDRGEDH